jgi:hypothetical protein
MGFLVIITLNNLNAQYPAHLQVYKNSYDAGNGTIAPILDFDGNSRFDNSNLNNTGTGNPVYSVIVVYECLLITNVESTKSDFIKIYPNPNNGIFSITGQIFSK